MSDLLGNFTDDEVEKYNAAARIKQAGLDPKTLKNKKSVFNAETGTHDILTEMSSGGYVKIGEETLDVTITRPGSILLNGKEYGRETPEYQRYYPDPEPQPEVMSTSPSMGELGQAEDAPFVSEQTRIEDARAYASSLGNPTAQDLLAAGYTPDIVNAVMGGGAQDNMPNQVTRTEPLSTTEVEDIIRNGGSVIGEYDPTLRETGRRELSEYLLGLAEQSFVEDLQAQGLTEDNIQRQLEAARPRLKNESSVLSDMFFGSPNSFGIGVGDFVTAGIMDIQEGSRLFSQGRNNGSVADRGLGALLVIAGLAEATGVGKLISKPLKKVIQKTRAGLADVGERLNQPGQMPTVGSNFGNFGQSNKRSFYVNAREGGAENENAKKQVLLISQGNKPKVENLATYFEQNHQNIYGRQLDPNNDADFDLVLDAAANEVMFQLDQAVSGKGWYDADVKKTFEILSKTPGLEVLENNETMRVLWSAMAAPTSIGNKVSNNTKAVTAAFLQFLKTGKVPVDPPLKGAVTEGIPGAGWGMKQKAVASGMRVIAHLVETKGLEGFADWLSPHTLQELTEIRKAAGLGGSPAGLGGGKDSIHLGAMVLGDKTGRYSLNINGYQGTTKDVWFARSYNRHFGNMRNQDGTLAAQPRNLPERKRMEEFTARLVDKLTNEGLSEQDAQAVLWFYEQNLYTDLGVLSRPGSFSEAAEKIGNDLRSGVRSSDATQTTAQSTDAELTNFRSISAPKRTVRSGRRGREVTGEASSPYTRGSGEGAEGDGLLVLNPDEQTQRIYNAAGISLPKINETQAAQTATQYNTDMTNAMSGHTFGAQVEIKSPEELADARLFRTENGSGFAIKPDGDIVAVFQSSNETGSVGYSMMQAAIAAGGKKLDAFDTFLSGIYETAGFKPVARLPWNDEFAPDNWDKNTFKGFNNGEPDVVFYVYDPNYFGGATNVPKFTNYDEAVAAQDAELARLNSTNN